jgi:hypothetical protein
MGILYMGNNEHFHLNEEIKKVKSTEQSPVRQAENTNYIYVSQDNYYIVRTSPSDDKSVLPKLYCDSATSCIIIVVTGQSKNGLHDICMISHLSRHGRFTHFFNLVEENFYSGYNVYAAGANPPKPYINGSKVDFTARDNALQVSNWCITSWNVSRLNVDQVSFRFGEGNPSVYANNLDCLSVDLVTGHIGNERISLTPEDRDPTGGIQTLFCMFGNPNTIRRQDVPFTKNETDALVRLAQKASFQKAATMSDREILQTYSSTPEFEVEWFCETIREAGKYTANYKF